MSQIGGKGMGFSRAYIEKKHEFVLEIFGGKGGKSIIYILEHFCFESLVETMLYLEIKKLRSYNFCLQFNFYNYIGVRKV